uniref:Uncharacterized protein n=1 Tax=Arundo donax TaxID=35708 RepID=A0A0A9C1P8_ARUDO
MAITARGDPLHLATIDLASSTESGYCTRKFIVLQNTFFMNRSRTSMFPRLLSLNMFLSSPEQCLAISSTPVVTMIHLAIFVMG